jgi:hypothetical protein
MFKFSYLETTDQGKKSKEEQGTSSKLAKRLANFLVKKLMIVLYVTLVICPGSLYVQCPIYSLFVREPVSTLCPSGGLSCRFSTPLSFSLPLKSSTWSG